ncbi:hypothetical protein GLOIN_2v1485513 [Rhizophagus irregularis DAOM 181602=DAOM 197198]|uniref:Uncharacterized protein n=1 Tax=Rhizophagus irregularis (strain DAOM 181602 / DAOM 197198 / MUCL 43194) TaxID=747089 RepID=A0A2P4PAF7_RHIID|nr:hypothetical protein GLOIN_2v1485513 [Rhizophagus irregularis DAOM 181602=DAOM 197198]POG62345.1 hypothetical protein GLOIN_2v1485513 [Rhizophagus irregularis DAOM 181602=DAOM 197198]|eukprot:XP_025169211.1 hypothetical protein GLOIN_2v1485513 [Rhizophagus irregularis DAOM 181602=DAOM 197198]
MYKLVAYKEELKNLTDKDIIDFYGGYDWFFGKTIYIKNKRKKKKAELPVTEEDMNLYDQVNRNCSSPEIKKEEISEEKIRQKRSSKEEISRVKVIGEDCVVLRDFRNTNKVYKKKKTIG